MTRITRAPDGQLAPGRSLAGRGAWLCSASFEACLELAVKRKALGRALRADVGVDDLARLRAYVAERARLTGCTPNGTTRGLLCNERDTP